MHFWFMSTYLIAFCIVCASGADGFQERFTTSTEDEILETRAHSPCSKEPSPPFELRLKSLGEGMVTLRWKHNSSECGPITRFEIEIFRLWTDLLEPRPEEHPVLKMFSENYTVDHSDRNYIRNFNLLSSTMYVFTITAINNHGRSSRTGEVYEVPSSVGFIDQRKLQLIRDRTSIELEFPDIVNATMKTRVKVIFEGTPEPPCTPQELPENLVKFLNVTNRRMRWLAGTIDVQQSRLEKWMIRNDGTDPTSGACFPSRNETYQVIVLLESDRYHISPAYYSIDSFNILKILRIMDSSSTPRPSDNLSSKHDRDPDIPDQGISYIFIPILLFLIVCVTLLMIWHRMVWKIFGRVLGRISVSSSLAVSNFVKPTTTNTPQDVSTMDSEQPKFVNIPEVFARNSYSHAVNIRDFENYVKESVASKVLQSQYEMFPRGVNKSSEHGLSVANKMKNRYANIVPYDDTRVILKKTSRGHNSQSDYINANYVKGFDRENAYIATQGPKPQTVVDFWRMIWQEEALVICMVANIYEKEKKKCEQYWPDFGQSNTYGEIIVETKKHEVFFDYSFRTLQVSCGEESREIEHLHYTGWADHDVPMYSNSVVAYLRKLHAIPPTKGPIIVHCSAGIGRTGSIILCDICLRQAAVSETIDVCGVLKNLRDCRMNMVDNFMQYLFVHFIIMEYLTAPSTVLECNDDLPQMIEELKRQLPQHIHRLNDTAWQDQALHPQITWRSLLPEQLAKNRFPVLAAANSNRVFLRRYPLSDIHSDYINAVIVDGAKTKKQYLASQLPLPSTLSDFYRLIAEEKVGLVIVLQQPDPFDLTCCDIVPSEGPINPVPFLSVELKSTSESEMPFRIVELEITNTSEVTNETQQVIMITCTEWGLGSNGKPPPPHRLIELWETLKTIHREGPTLVICYDGVTGCGLYLALSFLLERMAVARECDIIHAVRAVRLSRSDFVQSQEQFEYLYEAAGKYIESFVTHANFP